MQRVSKAGEILDRHYKAIPSMSEFHHGVLAMSFFHESTHGIEKQKHYETMVYCLGFLVL